MRAPTDARSALWHSSRCCAARRLVRERSACTGLATGRGLRTGSTSPSCSSTWDPTARWSASTAASRCSRGGASLPGARQRPFHEADATSLPVENASSTPRFRCRCSRMSPRFGRARRDVPGLACRRSSGLWDVDWATVSLHTTDCSRTERILRSWDGHLRIHRCHRPSRRNSGGRGSPASSSRATLSRPTSSIRTHMAVSSFPSSHSSWSGVTGSRKTRRTHGKPSSGSWRSAGSSSSPAPVLLHRDAPRLTTG